MIVTGIDRKSGCLLPKLFASQCLGILVDDDVKLSKPGPLQSVSPSLEKLPRALQRPLDGQEADELLHKSQERANSEPGRIIGIPGLPVFCDEMPVSHNVIAAQIAGVVKVAYSKANLPLRAKTPEAKVID